jgi:hypothetical protein
MMHAVILAGQRLAEALRAENEALAALDLSRATGLATAKMQATDSFAGAHAAAAKLGAHAIEGTEQRRAAESLTTRLADLGAENRRLLERAIALQSRVIETIAGAAIPRAAPGGYGAAGARSMPHQTPALALSARA